MQNAAGGEGQGGHKAGVVSFRSVPAFVFAREVMVDTREWGPVQVDIAYGGAFYAVLAADSIRSEEHTPELQSLMRISYAVFCLKKKKIKKHYECALLMLK